MSGMRRHSAIVGGEWTVLYTAPGHRAALIVGAAFFNRGQRETPDTAPAGADARVSLAVMASAAGTPGPEAFLADDALVRFGDTRTLAKRVALNPGERLVAVTAARGVVAHTTAIATVAAPVADASGGAPTAAIIGATAEGGCGCG